LRTYFCSVFVGWMQITPVITLALAISFGPMHIPGRLQIPSM
jgi:hypothetical protein